MVETDILPIRLNSQLLLPESGKSVQEVVAHLGALQAQDYAMMKWAIGSRLPGSTETDIESALDRGEILRTHVFRPTWHVVSAQDIHWMLELTAPRIRTKMKTRDAQLGLTASIITKSKDIVVKALEGGFHKTKEELDVLLNRASIPTTEYRDAHLLMHAELDGLICSGRTIGNNRSYALLESRAPVRQHLTKEEALAKLAKIYFTSRCPATIQDFIWWSGLNIGEARLAVEALTPQFHTETIGHQTYILPESNSTPSLTSEVLHLIPAFDEFILAYRDRSATLIPERFQKVVSNNGVFRPALLLNGRVIGIWKRTTKKDVLRIEVLPFEQFGSEITEKIDMAFTIYSQFHGKKSEVYIGNIL